MNSPVGAKGKTTHRILSVYLLERKDEWCGAGLEAYDSFVVVAQNPVAAKKFLLERLESCGLSDAWPDDPKLVRAILIGQTRESRPSVVLGSFNAL